MSGIKRINPHATIRTEELRASPNISGSEIDRQPIESQSQSCPLKSLSPSSTSSQLVRLQVSLKYPLDVVKTRVQLQTSSAGPDGYNGMVDCFRKIIKNEGVSRLYRGIEAPILMEAPKRATKFAANESWGKFYRDIFGVAKMNQSLSILTGATAGATESFVVVPFELVKIRLQDRASAGKYSGMIDCVSKIVKAEGPLALYNGLESTMWRHILWNAGYFGCIFQVKALMPTPESKKQEIPKVAGLAPKYNWAWPALGTVMKEEGFAALYKGFLPKVLRLGPGGGILLVVFTGVTDFFRKLRADKGL
ncbi:hypothetical protein EYC84_009929 [Monilinia fructicola]|uniref:Uncharacterized protein n=1 Tax=Monilinia fructicola TaxID=38448 RepID=A0A5M9JDU9_MONFR|nr:hypothetical protein EYC84_009929 [Monilinia fructicola]